MVALVDTPAVRGVRRRIVVVLTALLVSVWAVPAGPIAVRIALSLLLAGMILTNMVGVVRVSSRTRRVPAFLWRQYRRQLAGSLARIVVCGALVAVLWVFPVTSAVSRTTQSTALAVLIFMNGTWALALLEWSHRRRTAGRSFDEDAHWRAHPVVEMWDQDGSRAAFPGARSALDWIEVMRPGDCVTFLHRDGGRLQVVGPTDGRFAVRSTSGDGSVLAAAADVDQARVRDVVLGYLERTTGVGPE